MSNPAKVVRAILVEQKLVPLIIPSDGVTTVPYVQEPGDDSTPCYVSSMPDDVDQALCIYNVAGKKFGRRMEGVGTPIHPGLKFQFRALTDDGYDVIQAIANAVDAIKSLTNVEVDGEDFYIQSVYRTSSVIELGEEPFRKRQLWTFNARVAFQDQQTPAMG